MSVRTLASAYNKRAIALKNKGQIESALADYGQSIRIDPSFSDPYYNRAQLLRSREVYDRAIADYDETIRLEPTYTPSWSGRADCWDYKKEDDRAIADYSEAIRLDPKYSYAFNGRADAWNSGQTALDGEGGNSPFAVAFVQRIATPNVEINKLFRLVRDDVMEATAVVRNLTPTGRCQVARTSSPREIACHWRAIRQRRPGAAST